MRYYCVIKYNVGHSLSSTLQELMNQELVSPAFAFPLCQAAETRALLRGQRASLMAQLVKNLPANAGFTRNKGLIPGLGRSPREGKSKPLQYSCLKNSLDRGVWWATVRGIANSWT